MKPQNNGGKKTMATLRKGRPHPFREFQQAIKIPGKPWWSKNMATDEDALNFGHYKFSAHNAFSAQNSNI